MVRSKSCHQLCREASLEATARTCTLPKQLLRTGPFSNLRPLVPTEGHLSPVFGFISSSIFADPQQLMEREIEEVRGRNVMMQGHEMKMPRDEGGR